MPTLFYILIESGTSQRDALRRKGKHLIHNSRHKITSRVRDRGGHTAGASPACPPFWPQRPLRSFYIRRISLYLYTTLVADGCQDSTFDKDFRKKYENCRYLPLSHLCYNYAIFRNALSLALTYNLRSKSAPLLREICIFCYDRRKAILGF